MSIKSQKYLDALKAELRDHKIELIQQTRIKLMQMLKRKGKSDEHIKILLETLETDRRTEQDLLNQRDNKKENPSTWGNTTLQ